MKNKITAFLIHLLGSLVLISTTAGFMIFYFYPGVLAEVMDVYDLIKIIIPVVIILGPLLTFVIYKKDKPGIKFDLSVIILFQFIAMAYGCHNLYIARPGFLIFYHDSFYIAPPSIDQSALINNPQKQHFLVGKFSRPQNIFFNLNTTLNEQMRLASESLKNNIPLQFNASYFQKFDTITSDILLNNGIPPEDLRKNTTDKNELEKLDTLEHSGKHYVYIPVTYGTTIKCIVVNLDSKEIEQSLNILPF